LGLANTIGENMRKTSLYLSLVIAAGVLLIQMAFAQGVGINNTGASPDPSAGLDVDFTNKGFLPPRMTTSQRNVINSPAQGLHIFNLDTDCIEVYFSSGGWLPVRCGCSSFPDATFTNSAGAANFPVNFSANTIDSSSTYHWSFGQGAPNTSSNSTESVTWTSVGTYPVSLTVTGSDNCSATSTQNVTIISCSSFPDATFTGGNGFTNSPIAFIANGSGLGYTYSWNFPSGTPSTSSLQNPSVQWAAPGNYIVNLTVTDSLGCSATETLSVAISLCSPEVWNFTNCGQTGRFGPTQAQCNTAYGSTNLNGAVTITGQGIQQWTVPSTGTYRITAMGAGANARQGGRGAEIIGDFTLTAGEVIRIIVGQRPEPFNTSHGGGAGGSFVVRAPYNTNASILVVAGGGGGGHNGGIQVNSHGNTTTTGGSGTNGVAGGSNGNGGTGQNSSGGAGFFGNGGAGSISGTVPSAFVNGGAGGITGSNQGGFGGGGHQGNSHGAGGGGYSGGGATGPSIYHGGGGGSYNNGSNQVNSAGVRNDHGLVTIERICL